MKLGLKKRLARLLVWSPIGLLVLVLCPGPVDGNWNWRPETVRGMCGCDSYRFERLQDGAVYELSSNHPPPLYCGAYKKLNFGRYQATYDWPGLGGSCFQISGFTTLFFRLEYSARNGTGEWLFYTRDFNPKARQTVRENLGANAQHMGSVLSVTPGPNRQSVILQFPDRIVSLDDVDGIAQSQARRNWKEVVLQSDMTSAELEPLVAKFEENGLRVLVKPQVPFR